MDDETQAIDDYLLHHHGCDLQKHPWQSVFRAGYGEGWAAGRDYAASAAATREPVYREALEKIAAHLVVYAVGDHTLPYQVALMMRTIASDALAAAPEAAPAQEE
jgi:hypothetical protein